MNTLPLISVIMSVYKEPAEWLHESIDSILNQTFSDFEFIIICDNPGYKEGKELLEEYKEKDKRIVLVFNEQNIGLTKSLNKGLTIAKGEYIARMDADDISLPDRFETQINFMGTHSNVDVCGMGVRMFGNKKLLSQKTKHFAIDHDDIITFMLFENPVAHPTVMYKRIINGQIVKYDEYVLKAQDYKLWFDLYKLNAKFHNIHKIGVKYRVSDEQISAKSTNSQISVGNEIRSNLLKTYLVSVESDSINLHNEICSPIKSQVNIETKKNWLKYLRTIMESKGFLTDEIDMKIFSLWVANCMLYSDKKGIFQYPNKSCRYYLKPVFFNNLFKTFLHL